jgi:gamma-glutamyltranspeptidase/glutathione hydrolase
MKRAVLLLMITTLFPCSSLASNRPIGKSFATRSEVIARNGMAATSQPLATQVALDILKAGGSAADAAIAANALLGLVEPQSCGIGGDLFAIVWDAKTARLHGLNASGRSPHALTLEHFRQQDLKHVPLYGPLSVSVPGCVDGWFELHQKFGKLPMAALLAPAIRYARDGFPVSEVIAHEWQTFGPPMEAWPGFKETFLPQGQPPRKGDLFRNPALAHSLEKIAHGGRDAFYRGDLARTIAAFMKQHGGFLAENDFSDHRSEWVTPISVNYRGYEVWELPPNTQGLAALQMLNILEGYDLKRMGFGSAEYIHHFVEAKKLAFEDRAKFYADPAFNQIPLQQLLAKSYAAERRQLINPRKASRSYEPGNPALHQGDTVYLTVADADGNLVSFIQSNYHNFGSGMVPDGCGFVLQNRGQMFRLEEGHFHSYAPHKRPFHTIIPAFITKDGKPFMSFGVMGGGMQPQGHVQIVVNLIDFGMSLQEAGDAPRIQHAGSSEPMGQMMNDGGEVFLEFGFPQESERDLLKLGHKVGKIAPGTFGGYQAIQYDPAKKIFYGASESRKDGQAAGY